MQIDHRCESAEATTSLTRKSRATAGESELRVHFILHNSSFSLSVPRPARLLANNFGVRCSAWLGVPFTSE
jgi:hypothetical protein